MPSHPDRNIRSTYAVRARTSHDPHRLSRTRRRPPRSAASHRAPSALLLLLGLWLVIFFASLFAPPLLDDADATHANAARHAPHRRLGHPPRRRHPLPRKGAAALLARRPQPPLFGFNTFAVHLPQALAVLLLALLGYRWARRAFGDRAALYTGLAILTSAGVFLFTRIFIPEVLLSLLLAAALYCFPAIARPHTVNVVTLSGAGRLRTAPARPTLSTPTSCGPPSPSPSSPRASSPSSSSSAPPLALPRPHRRTTANGAASSPSPASLLFLAIAAPWHILAGLRNTGGMNGHGFFWFYFINEHVLRFLGRRIPRTTTSSPATSTGASTSSGSSPGASSLPSPHCSASAAPVTQATTSALASHPSRLRLASATSTSAVPAPPSSSSSSPPSSSSSSPSPPTRSTTPSPPTSRC